LSRKTNGATRLRGATDGAPPDAELMAGLARGEAELLGDLYRRHNRTVFRFICRMLLDVPIEQAEDLCQEVFMAVLDAAPRYREEGKFTSWLLGITMRQVRTWQRTQINRQQLLRERGSDGVMLVAAEPEGPEDTVERRETIQRALSGLTRDQREVLMLRAAEGRSGEEIARVLGISETAVWSRLKRAHRTARDSVNPPPPSRPSKRRG
jgi:RNA polymerase sigma-70 factor (ECF subfamily)